MFIASDLSPGAKTNRANTNHAIPKYQWVLWIPKSLNYLPNKGIQYMDVGAVFLSPCNSRKRPISDGCEFGPNFLYKFDGLPSPRKSFTLEYIDLHGPNRYFEKTLF